MSMPVGLNAPAVANVALADDEELFEAAAAAAVERVESGDDAPLAAEERRGFTFPIAEPACE